MHVGREQDPDEVGDTLVSQPGTMHSTSGLSVATKVRMYHTALPSTRRQMALIRNFLKTHSWRVTGWWVSAKWHMHCLQEAQAACSELTGHQSLGRGKRIVIVGWPGSIRDLTDGIADFAPPGSQVHQTLYPDLEPRERCTYRPDLLIGLMHCMQHRLEDVTCHPQRRGCLQPAAALAPASAHAVLEPPPHECPFAVCR